MSQVPGVIAEFVSGGVPFKTLGNPSVAAFRTGAQLNRSTLGKTGRFPVVNGGTSPSGFHNEANTSGPAVTISQGGASAGYVGWIDTPFWAGAHCYVVDPGSDVDQRFLYHALKWLEPELRGAARGAGIPGLGRTALGAVKLPIPPLEVQREIARILDHFTEMEAQLEAELEAELEARREQFSTYRDSLVNPSSNCEWWTLREVAADFGRGKSKHRPRNDPRLYDGPYPFIQTGDVRKSGHRIVDYSQTYSEQGLAQSKLWPKGTICITIAANIAETGVLAFDACFPDSVIGLVLNPERASAGYVEYLLQSLKSNLVAKGKGSAQANINLATFEEMRFPFPDLDEQERIAATLDRFDALVNDLSIGLPAELAARRNQYEYYRDKLLTFEEAPA